MPSHLKQVAVSAAGAFLSLWVIGLLAHYFFPDEEHFLLMAAFGSSAILIFVMPHSPYAQPWPAIASHTLASLVGVFLRGVSTLPLHLNFPLAVTLTLIVLLFTRSVHPPAGGTALAAMTATGEAHDLGYAFALFPMASGMVVMVLVSVVFHNLVGGRGYPWRAGKC